LNHATNPSGWDLLNIVGTLNVQSTASNTFTIKLTSLTAGGAPGPIDGFSSNGSYAWTVATASGGILNFDPTKFAIDTSAFNNAFTGTFTVTTVGNSLVVQYTGITPPPTISTYGMVPGGFTLTFSGTSGQTYGVYSSTNTALPLASWDLLTSGTFGASPVSYTNSPATDPQRFYRVKSP
jgi:hypothetical protein